MNDKSTVRLREDSSPKKGEQIDGRYRVEEVIGRGGMGCIVRARQLAMERDVAIKLLHPHVADDQETVARFKREVHLAKSLAHPNIIQYYDFGKLPDDSLYLVMELLEGCDLHQELRQKGNFGVHRAIDITLQILDGLVEAHSHKVIHRDLKPKNLFLQHNRRGDHIKILDFGIAKSTQSAETAVTRTGVICGTPSYLAPEILITQDAGPASDLYAVGLILLEMLIGRRVFKADTMARTFFMQLRQPVPVPECLRNTPLHPFLMDSLAKHPDDRFQSAEEMMDELEVVRAQFHHDVRLSRDDIDSLVDSMTGSTPGMSGVQAMGLDVLRDPDFGNATSPTRSSQNQPSETREAPKSTSKAKGFAIAGMVAALLLAVGLSVRSFMSMRTAVESTDQASTAAQTSAGNEGQETSPVPPDQREAVVEHEMHFAAEPEVAPESDSTDSLPANEDRLIRKEKRLKEAPKQPESGSQDSQGVDPSAPVEEQPPTHDETTSSSADSTKPQQGESKSQDSIDAIMKDNTIMGDDENAGLF
jgi:serine/threonine-protein kinase